MKKGALLLFWIVCCNFGCVNRSTENQAQRQLNLFVWSAYIPDQTLHNFEKDTNIEVTFDSYESNEALLEKMQSGVADYDVIVPSDYMVRILREQGLLEKIDLTSVPNLRNIGLKFRNLPFDPKNENSIPFLWSTTGIGYNKNKIREPVDSWSILWNPRYKHRILMLDDMRECFAAALKWKGHSINTRNPDELAQARDLLVQQKPLLKTYNSSNFDEILMSSDVWLALGWSGNMILAIEQNPNLGYAIPKEGAAIAVENFCIPKGAKHLQEAHEFINYCLDARVGGEITNLSRYPNTNDAAKAYIKPEILNNPVCYPDELTIARCEFFSDLGPTFQILDRYWTEIKSK